MKEVSYKKRGVSFKSMGNLNQWFEWTEALPK